MHCEELARVWPDKFPRPDAETTQQNKRMIKKFGADFGPRDPATISREEALEYALNNPTRVRFIRSMFNDFQGIGLVEQNVWSALPLPAPGKEPVVVPTIGQIEALVSLAREWEYFSLAGRIEFAAHVGLRFAEQQAVLVPGATGSALGNPFVDTLGQRLAGDSPLPRKRVQIDWQKGRNGKLKRPKTARGIRPVMIPERAREAVELVLEHRRSRRSEFLWPESRETHRRQWSKLRREAGIWFKWHNLRHYCATWLLNNDATVDDVATQLGIRPEEVRDTYGHPDTEITLARLEGLVDG